MNICACGCVQVGDYDVLLTFADHDAVEFFAKCGFNDDPILNSPFRPFLDDDWDQSILMSYYRPVAAEHGGRGWNIPRLVAATGEFAPLEQAASSPLADDIRAWRETRVREYGAQLGLVERMQNEITALQSLVATQESRLSLLQRESAAARKQLLQQQPPTPQSEARTSTDFPCKYQHSTDGTLWGCYGPLAAEFTAVQRMLTEGVSSGSQLDTQLTRHTGAGDQCDHFSLAKLCVSSSAA